MQNINGYQKKKIPIGLFVILLCGLLIFAYYVSGIFTYEGLSLNTIEMVLVDVFTHPFRNYFNDKTVMCIMAAFLIWMMIISYYLTYHRNFLSGAEHGSAQWLDVFKANKELCDFKDDSQNRILSQNLKVGMNRLSNYNMLIMGSSGSFKTTSVMHQNLLQFGATYVVLDVKGDTQRKLGNAFLKAGYTIKSLNLKVPQKSDRINPMAYIECEDDLLRVVKTLQDAARPNKQSNSDPFWEDGSRLYLQSLFYYEWLDAREGKRPAEFNNILNLVNLENQKVSITIGGKSVEKTRLEMLMDKLAENKGDDYPPVRDYRKLKTGAPETVGTIVLMINAMLAICETAEIKRIFSGNDINIRELGLGVNGDTKKKTILFLVVPDNNNAYNFLISMFYTQMFDLLIRASDDELKAPLPIRVEFWMDEFYAGARPTDTDVLLGVVRSRNISMIPILQSVSQIKTLFRDDKWETMMDNLASVVYLGSGPMAESTHKFISEALGKTTIDTLTDNINKGNHGSTGLNFQRIARELMTADEVKQLPTIQSIIFLEGRPPIRDYKSIPFDKQEMGYLAPDWLKNRYSKALALGDYEHPVCTVYDAANFKYVTVDMSESVKFISRDEAQVYMRMAEQDEHIHVYDFDENDLIYVNFLEQRDRSEKELEQMLQEVMIEYETIKERWGKTLLINEISEKQYDKSKWISYGNLAKDLEIYFEQLTGEERELFLKAIDVSVGEDELNGLLFMNGEKMRMWLNFWIAKKVTRNKDAIYDIL